MTICDTIGVGIGIALAAATCTWLCLLRVILALVDAVRDAIVVVVCLHSSTPAQTLCGFGWVKGALVNARGIAVTISITFATAATAEAWCCLVGVGFACIMAVGCAIIVAIGVCDAAAAFSKLNLV